VAKGGAAANLLSANQAEPAVDDYTLIYDLDEAPARQLAEQWPSLPDAVQVSSAEEGALSAARDRTGWHGRRKRRSVRSRPQRGSTTNVGTASATRRVLTRSSTTPTTRCGLVPAMALTESTGEAAADRQDSSVPTTQELDCQNCGRATDHRFKTHESVPDAAWTGQPIWECRVWLGSLRPQSRVGPVLAVD